MTAGSPSETVAVGDAARRCEVFVIGGGPAGATMAALLARQGRDVVLAEKSRHPRFHIGESLLPANVALFDQLGVRDQVEAIGMPKWGVEFVSPTHEHHGHIDFAEAWDKSMPYAWQVRRSALDEILFRHARTCGARAHEHCRVREVAFDDDGATLRTETTLDDGTRTEQRWHARFVVDASGRDTLLASQLGAKRKNPKHASSAVFAHYTGVPRPEGKRAGDITIFWFEHGWFWLIPLADGTTSVGAVCWPHYLKSRSKPLKEFFDDTIALAPALAERLKDARLVDDTVHATGNYSYTSTHSSGPRYLLLGDAYAFIDPVFSSGVYLAMQSAFMGADVVTASLDRPRHAALARRAFDRAMRRGPREFSWFIFRVTNPTMREFFMDTANPMRMKEAVISLLAGDIHGRTPIWRSLALFKLVYLIASLVRLRRSWAAWRRRRHNIRDVGPLAGETILDTGGAR